MGEQAALDGESFEATLAPSASSSASAAATARVEGASAGLATAANARGASVAGQLGAAILSRGDDRRIVLQLDPAELGRVQIELTFKDDAVSLSIRAERQDALDLMRRHGGDLERQLREAGLDFENLSFSREEGGGGAWAENRREDPARDGFAYRGAARLETETAELQSAPPPSVGGWSGGVDLRV